MQNNQHVNAVGISTRVSEPVAERLAIVAAEQGRTLAGHVRFLITQAVAAKKIERQ